MPITFLNVRGGLLLDFVTDGLQDVRCSERSSADNFTVPRLHVDKKY